MLQRQLPMFSEGATEITHDENDDASFKMIAAQFYTIGYVKQMDIVRAFGVTPISVKRALKLYKEEGVQGFYAQKMATHLRRDKLYCVRWAIFSAHRGQL